MARLQYGANPENLNLLSRVHARYRRQTDRQTNGCAMPLAKRNLVTFLNVKFASAFTFVFLCVVFCLLVFILLYFVCVLLTSLCCSFAAFVTYYLSVCNIVLPSGVIENEWMNRANPCPQFHCHINSVYF